jgi:hypothetical protein
MIALNGKAALDADHIHKQVLLFCRQTGTRSRRTLMSTGLNSFSNRSRETKTREKKSVELAAYLAPAIYLAPQFENMFQVSGATG